MEFIEIHRNIKLHLLIATEKGHVTVSYRQKVATSLSNGFLWKNQAQSCYRGPAITPSLRIEMDQKPNELEISSSTRPSRLPNSDPLGRLRFS
jgi:hypothetical protein